MDIYYAVTNYHLLCCFLHKMKYNSNPAIMLISEYLVEIKPDIVKKIKDTKIFNDVFIIDKPSFSENDEFLDNKKLDKRINEIDKKIGSKYSHIFSKSNELFICCDFDELGIYLINNNIKYNYFEDGCGIFSREYLVLKVVHERKKFIEKLGCLGNNKSVIKRFGSLIDQEDGYFNQKDCDFCVKEILKSLNASQINLLLGIYNLEKINIDSVKVDLLLTMHYNEIMTQDMQREIYAYLIDYFKDEDEKLIIKPHPADSIFNYNSIFEDAIELNRYMPSELFPYCIDKKFEKGITCWSTSVYSLGKIIKTIVNFDSRIDKTFKDFNKYYAVVMYLKKIKTNKKIYLNLDGINELQFMQLLDKYFSTYKKYYTFDQSNKFEKINILYNMKDNYQSERTIVIDSNFDSDNFISINKKYFDDSVYCEYIGLYNFEYIKFNISKNMKYSKFNLIAKMCSVNDCFKEVYHYLDNNKSVSINEIRDYETNIRLLKEQLDNANNEINSIYSSSSWKITKPIRKLIDILRNIK